MNVPSIPDLRLDAAIERLLRATECTPAPAAPSAITAAAGHEGSASARPPPGRHPGPGAAAPLPAATESEAVDVSPHARLLSRFAQSGEEAPFASPADEGTYARPAGIGQGAAAREPTGAHLPPWLHPALATLALEAIAPREDDPAHARDTEGACAALRARFEATLPTLGHLSVSVAVTGSAVTVAIEAADGAAGLLAAGAADLDLALRARGLALARQEIRDA